MEQKLGEYRCLACGKLLFKGLLLLSTVEVKCRRCRELRLYAPESLDTVSFVLTADENGTLIEASREAEYVLSEPRENLIGKSITEICPGFVLADIKPAQPYHLKDNAFLLRDGKNLSVESYVVHDRDSRNFRLVNIVNPIVNSGETQ